MLTAMANGSPSCLCACSLLLLNVNSHFFFLFFISTVAAFNLNIISAKNLSTRGLLYH